MSASKEATSPLRSHNIPHVLSFGMWYVVHVSKKCKWAMHNMFKENYRTLKLSWKLLTPLLNTLHWAHEPPKIWGASLTEGCASHYEQHQICCTIMVGVRTGYTSIEWPWRSIIWRCWSMSRVVLGTCRFLIGLITCLDVLASFIMFIWCTSFWWGHEDLQLWVAHAKYISLM